MIKKLRHYLKVWILMSRNSFISWIGKRALFFIFLLGKTIRYAFYFSFLYYLVRAADGIASFTGQQALFFVATYVLIDTTAQTLFRSVYAFRPLVVSGDFDLILLKPLNPLFRVLLGGADPMDFVTLPPILCIVYLLGSQLNPTSFQVILYILLCLNGLIISMAIHILVLSLGIITLEIDHTIMVYRDLTSMGRLPIDIYKEPLKSILTFVVPVGVMITLPAKGLMGLVTPGTVLTSLVFGTAFLVVSLKFWYFALKKYTSASS